MHARNSSRDSQAKLIVRSVVKWREFRGNKKIALTLICYARFTQDFNDEFVITSKIALLLGATAIISENHQQILEKKERQYNIGYTQACWINTQGIL